MRIKYLTQSERSLSADPSTPLNNYNLNPPVPGLIGKVYT